MNEFITEVDPAVLVLVAGLLPALQAVINGCRWPSNLKALVSVGVAIGVGCLAAWVMGVDSRAGYITTAAAVYGLSQVGYFGVWKPTGASDNIERNVLPRDGTTPRVITD